MDICVRVPAGEVSPSRQRRGLARRQPLSPFIARDQVATQAPAVVQPLCHRAQEVLLRDSAPRLLVTMAGRVEGTVGPVLETLASSGGCLRIEAGQLLGTSRNSQAKLDALLAEAGERITDVQVLFHEEKEERPVLLVSARRSSYAAGEAILLQLRKPARQRVQLPDLMRLFDLTKAECQVISMLLNGQCAASIAAEQQISDLTVRTHLKRCYQKLEVRTKEQLFAKLLRLMTD